jgi:hypothetical protein
MLPKAAHRQTLTFIHHPDHRNQLIRWCTFINLRSRDQWILNGDRRDSRNSSGPIIPESLITRHQSLLRRGRTASLTSASKKTQGVALMRLQCHSWSIRVFVEVSTKELCPRSPSNRSPANTYNHRSHPIRWCTFIEELRLICILEIS